MDEVDAQMQMDRSPQAGSLDHMDFEHSDEPSSSAIARDMEIEYDDDTKEALTDTSVMSDQRNPEQQLHKHDHEMNAETAETEQGWRASSADVVNVPDQLNAHEVSVDGSEVQGGEQIEQRKEDEDKQHAEHKVILGDEQAPLPSIRTPERTTSNPRLPSPHETRPRSEQVDVVSQEVHEATLANVQQNEKNSAPIHTGLHDVSSSEALSTLPSQGTDSLQDIQDDIYADAPVSIEPIASSSAVPYTDGSTLAPHEIPSRRLPLQKDYLSHVDVFHGYDPSSISDSVERRFAPHVSLIFNDHEYSLFRPTSSPSGDDEEVLFGDDQEHQESGYDPDQELYYASLDNLFEAFYRTFPDLQTDGENELILDFGVLDMQVSEDNVYSRQLSLHDFDRIRVGMCQPELDRLQVTLKIGKRFAFRFNELAEHCYRMHAGSDDSGTIYEEILDPLTTNDEEEEHATQAQDETVYCDDEQGDVETALDSMTNLSSADTLGADYITGINIEDLADPSLAANEQQDALAESGGDASAAALSDDPQNTDEVVASASDEQGDVHPPSDEHYQDPEFADGVEPAYVEEDDATVGAEDVGDQDDDVVDTVVEEYDRAIDPEASVEDVAEQVAEYEEEDLGREEAVESEAAADARTRGDSFLTESSERKVDVNGNEDAKEYYHKLSSPVNEEVCLVEKSDTSAPVVEYSEDEPSDNLEIIKGTILSNDTIELATESDTRILSSKRSRDDDQQATRDSTEIGLGESNSLEVKRPKIAA